MIGNSWHLPTCRFLLFAVLLANQAISLQALGQDSRYTQVQTPLLEVRFHPDGSRPLCRMASFWRRSGINWDPKEPRQPQLQPPGRDEFAHFQWALSLQWLDLFPVNLNRCLQWALDMQQHMGASLQQWRDSVREDVQALVRELAEEQEAWMSAAPAHVIRVYKQGTGRNVVSLLVMAHLLQLFAFPEFELLVRDLFHSFPLLGPVGICDRTPSTLRRGHSVSSRLSMPSTFAKLVASRETPSTRRLFVRKSRPKPRRTGSWVLSAPRGSVPTPKRKDFGQPEPSPLSNTGKSAGEMTSSDPATTQQFLQEMSRRTPEHRL